MISQLLQGRVHLDIWQTPIQDEAFMHIQGHVCVCVGGGGRIRLIVGFQPLTKHDHITDCKLDSVVYAGVCVES